MEKNQFIGISIITVMMIGYFFFVQDNQATLPEPQNIEVVANSTTPTTNSNSDSNIVANVSSQNVKETTVITQENEDVEIEFSNYGATIKKVTLKKHKTYLKEPLVLIDEKNNRFDYSVGDIKINDIAFNAPKDIKTTNDTTSLTFIASAANGQLVEVSYKIPSKGYLIKKSISIEGSDATALTLDWNNKMKRFEKGVDESLNRSTFNYYSTSGDFDDIGHSKDFSQESIAEPLKWISSKQRFFNVGIIADQALTGFSLSTMAVENDTNYIRINTAKGNIIMKNGTASLDYYVGPNDYKITKKITDGYSNNVYMGWAIFSVINKFLVVPIFKFLENIFSNYGIIILILVLIIKTILFPIAYKSYLSMAKMKELQPELAKIKEAAGDDAQKVQQEQMKLYSQVGVNPLAGCIPMVLQMPILFSLFNFFPNSIELRGQAFLWAKDLSTYDAPISWGFEIPLLGDHISMFTLLMTLSTLAYTYYNNQLNTAAQQGPMKYMGYMMPVIFFFALNNFSAGLTYYYFVSNVITISQQLLASKFIDKDKIRVKMEENRKNAAAGKGKKSKFQQRLQDAMKAQQETAKNKKK